MKFFRKLTSYHEELIRSLFIVLVVSAVYFFFLTDIKFLAIPKLKAQDIMAKAAHLIRPQTKNIDKVVVIAVDDDSFKYLNKKWPWRRIMFAYMVDKIAPAKPKVIAFDISFIGESEIPEDDAIMGEAFASSNNVITASYFTSDGKYMKPFQKIDNASRGYGFINKPRDIDFYIRRSRAVLFSKEDKKVDFSLSIKAFALYKDLPLDSIKYDGKTVSIKDTIIPVDKEGTFALDYRRRFKEFTIIPFWQIIKTDFPEDTFKDKIILIGPTNEILHDIHNTPLGLIPGVVINANELLMFLNNDFVKNMPKWLEFLILCIFVICISILTYRARKPRIIFKVVGAVIIFWELGLLLYLHNIRINYLLPLP